MSKSTERLARHIEDLYATDAQFAAAKPIEAIAKAVEQPGIGLRQIIRTVMEGYADRPAVGQRAVSFVSDAAGRTTPQLQPDFETITYRELWGRTNAFASALAGDVRFGDRVGVLGFTSVDYTTIDIALTLLGAVSVPLQTSAATAQLRPVVTETEPALIAASIDNFANAVELMLTGHAPARLLAFDYHPEVDAHREALEAARARLADSAVVVETLADVLERGRTQPPVTPFDHEATESDDALSLLIYTSGSTGAPKGAMYPASRVVNFWRKSSSWFEVGGHPSITLNFMPMSHVMGRQVLYGTLCNGGTAYFVAKSDLSTLFEDLALVRPTELNFVPRVWDMLFEQFQSELDRRSPEDADQVTAELRRDLLGDRFVAALTGSAPISAEMKVWVESLLQIHLVEGYGSTEAGSVLIDNRIKRPTVIDYKLVDVPELGYFATDRPHPRGELLVKTQSLSPATTSGPKPPPACSTRTASTGPAT